MQILSVVFSLFGDTHTFTADTHVWIFFDEIWVVPTKQMKGEWRKKSPNTRANVYWPCCCNHSCHFLSIDRGHSAAQFQEKESKKTNRTNIYYTQSTIHSTFPLASGSHWKLDLRLKSNSVCMLIMTQMKWKKTKTKDTPSQHAMLQSMKVKWIMGNPAQQNCTGDKCGFDHDRLHYMQNAQQMARRKFRRRICQSNHAILVNDGNSMMHFDWHNEFIHRKIRCLCDKSLKFPKCITHCVIGWERESYKRRMIACFGKMHFTYKVRLTHLNRGAIWLQCTYT